MTPTQWRRAHLTAKSVPDCFFAELNLGIGTKTCGSWLASDGVLAFNIGVGCAGLIAGKPAPTGIAFHI